MRSAVAATLLALAYASAAFSHETEEAFAEKIRTYILANPEIILEAMDVLASREAEAEVASLLATSATEILNPDRAIVLGDPAAPHRIFELFDYRCASCKAGHPVLEAFVAENPDVAVMVQQLPILGPQSDRAARAYLAVFELGGAEAAARLHAVLFDLAAPLSPSVLESVLSELGHNPEAVEDAMYAAEITARINANKDAALALGAIGTPVFVTERRVHQGVATMEVLEEMLADLRAN